MVADGISKMGSYLLELKGSSQNIQMDLLLNIPIYPSRPNFCSTLFICLVLEDA
jgi:hypothetical protein